MPPDIPATMGELFNPNNLVKTIMVKKVKTKMNSPCIKYSLVFIVTCFYSSALILVAFLSAITPINPKNPFNAST